MIIQARDTLLERLCIVLPWRCRRRGEQVFDGEPVDRPSIPADAPVEVLLVDSLHGRGRCRHWLTEVRLETHLYINVLLHSEHIDFEIPLHENVCYRMV